MSGNNNTALTHESLEELFTDCADALRESSGESGTIVADQFPEKIRALRGGANFAAFTFEAVDWSEEAEAAGWTLSIPAECHQQSSSVFMFQARHLVDGVLRTDTWAARGTRAAYDTGSGAVVLWCEDPYPGEIILTGR